MTTSSTPLEQQCTNEPKNRFEPGFLSSESIINFKQVTISLDEIKDFSIQELEFFLLNIAKVRGEMLQNEQNTKDQLPNRLYTIAKAVSVLISERRRELQDIAA